MSFYFNGRQWTSPATVSAVDDTEMYNRRSSVGNVLAIIGRSEGGAPLEALEFQSASEARKVLRSGESLKAIEKAFDPSEQTEGPAQVVFIRVNPAVQSVLTLNDGLGTPVIDLASTDYGMYTNNIKVKIESGSTVGKKLTSMFGESYYSADNVYRDAFSVVYTGVAAIANIVVAPDLVTLIADGDPKAVIDLNVYKTIQEVVDRINATADFTASVLDGNGEKPALNGLDNQVSLDIKTGEQTVTAHLQAVVDWFNGTAEGYVTAARKAGVGTVPANIGYSYLSGGSDGVVTNDSWQSAFDVLQQEDVQWVVPVTSLSAVHAMAGAHCAYMSSVARMERRCINGMDLGTTDAAALEAAKSLNSDRVGLVHIGVYHYNDKGVLTLYPPYILAAQLAGAFAGVNPGTALTNKTIKIQGLERKLRNPTDTDDLINGGIMCVEDTANGFKVVKSVSTWLANDNYSKVEMSCGVAIDFTIRSVREAVDELRGEKGTPQLLSQAISRAETRLRELARPEPMGPGVLAGDTANPAYKNIVATLEGDGVRLEFQCSPVIPCNYVGVTMHAVPYSGSASI